MSENRHFTVAVFLAHQGRVLLLFHRSLQRWLPPGGHLEPGETPDEAARREVREETGLQIELPPQPASLVPGSPPLLAQPAAIQLETVGPGHQHIDLVYFARPATGSITPRASLESLAIGWYAPADWDGLGVDEEIQTWSRKALCTALWEKGLAVHLKG